MQETITSTPKKRGRKPKSSKEIPTVLDTFMNKKIENNEDDNKEIEEKPVEEKEIKKRGRKKQIKPPPSDSDNEDNKNSKKRGRKPKEKVYSIGNVSSNKNEGVIENIILHLPLTINDFPKNKEEKVIDKNFVEEVNENIENKNLSENNENDDSKIEYKQNLNNLEQVDSRLQRKILKRNMKNIILNFVDTSNKKQLPKNNNKCCKWCIHPFENEACVLPVKYIKGEFYVIGYFCSFNCAAAFNFDEKPYDMWNRYSLLNFLYKKMYNTKYIHIKPAQDRFILDVFPGGIISIEEFRKNFLLNISYKMVIPPMISIVPKLEETVFEPLNANNEIISLDNEIENKLKLKREKPLINPKNTLESYMDLKINS